MTREDEQARRYVWKAIQETLSDGRLRVRVIGTSPGTGPDRHVALTRAPFQGSNPNILLLRFESDRGRPTPSHRAAAITVAYEETGGRRYKLVSIQPGGIDIAVEGEA